MTSTRPVQTSDTPLTRNEPSDCAPGPAPLLGQSTSAVMEKTALDNVSVDLIEQIVDPANLERAWKKVRANRGAPGPDGIKLAEFPELFREQWPEIEQQLLNGTYQPGPARRKSISKEDGTQRHLGIPTVTGKSTPVQSAFGLR